MARAESFRRPALATVLATALLGGTGWGAAPVEAQTPAARAVVNHSFETVGRQGRPLCWQMSRTGSNVARMATVGPGRSGGLAARLNVSELRSGSRSILVDQRTRGCAPAITPGQRYQLSAAYTSTTPVRLTAYYRDAEGSWHRWAVSHPWKARRTWGTARLLTPVVPARASLLSFGPTVAAVGRLTVDDVRYVRAPSRSPGPVVAVSTAAGLSAALAAARPGTTIRLADGRYIGHFTARTPGTATAPIRLTGSRAAILDGGGITGGYALHLDRASYWRLDGFSVTNAGKAIVLDEVGHTALNNLYLHHTGQEAVLMRNYSRDNVLSNSEVAYTGLRTPGYGEGVYVGLAKSNWGAAGQSRTGGAPDSSDRNQVVGNYIHDTSAENVDIKEGTTGGLVAGNRFDSGGMSAANYADSWVDVAGNGWVVRDNTGTNPGGSLVDGFQTHVQLGGWARDNLFSGNVAAVNAGGYGFKIQTPGSGNTVTASNRVTGAARGVSNITLTR